MIGRVISGRYVVQAIVGHTSTAMTHHYYHANESALRKAVNAIPSFAKDGKSARKGAVYSDSLHGYDSCGCRLPTFAQRLMRADRLLKSGLISAQEHAGLRERILAEA